MAAVVAAAVPTALLEISASGDPNPTTVSSVSPDIGPVAGGTVVTVTGTNFVIGATTVDFGNTASPTVTVASATSLTAVAPAEANGLVDITVTTIAGTSGTGAGDLFAYGTPQVTGLNPDTGPITGGTVVTVTGVGFTSGSTVRLGGTPMVGLITRSATSLTATTPPETSGSFDITVTTGVGTSPLNAGDLFSYSAPTVTGLSSSVGPAAGGTTTVVTGTGFTDNAVVNFGMTTATSVTVTSATTLTATSPPGTVGPVDVTVTAADGTSTTTPADVFTYGILEVTSVSADAGPAAGGTGVTIAGTGFAPGATVDFGGTPATDVDVQSPGVISATAPPSTPGEVDVTVTEGTLTSPTSPFDMFAYDPPTLSVVTPDSGALLGGTVVTVTGTGFAPDSTVDFGTAPATSVTVDSGTELTAVAPAGLPGPVDVTVTTPAGPSAVNPGDQFTYDGVPYVSIVSPNASLTPSGVTVTLTGTGFTPDSSVMFGSIPATSVTVLTSSTLQAVSPPGNTGAVNITVTTPGGYSVPWVADLYATGPPVVTGLTPDVGSENASTSVTIIGTGFVPGTTVTFGSVSATSVFVTNGTDIAGSEITAVTPAQTVPQVDVRAATAGGTSAISAADEFVYGGVDVTGLSPDTGPTSGGAQVTVTGLGFTPDATVSFGGTPATSVVDTSDTTLVATAPPLPAGAVDVVVSTATGTSRPVLDDLFGSGPPAVTSLSTDGGPLTGGTEVTITGSGFVPGATVSFGTAPATDVAVDSATQITAVSPAGTAGTVQVAVSTGQGASAATNGDLFVYGLPVVTSVSPASGPTSGGGSVTITGSGFTPDSVVAFGMYVATPVIFTSPTTLSVIAPAVPLSMTGVTDITVRTVTGTSAVNPGDEFSYNDELQISCSPPPYASGVAACPGINLPAIDLNGFWQAAQTSANTVYITDNRNEADAGWSVSAYMMPTASNPNPYCADVATFCNSTAGSDSISPMAKIPASYLTIGNVSCTGTAGNTSPDPTAGSDAVFPATAGAVSLCTAQPGSSAGTFKLGATFSLAIPPWVYMGQYQATVEYLVM